MATVLGSLLVSLGLESGEFKSGLNAAEKQLRASQKRIEAVGKSMSGLGRSLSLAVTVPIVAMAAASVKGAQAQAEAMGQVNAALKSMGDGAGRTSQQLLKMSDAMEMKSLFDGDEILRKLTANLLTFDGISGQTFDRAQQAILDMATRLRMDLQPATIMVGKALTDPKNGLAALSRTGAVTREWIDANEDLITHLVDTGRKAEAQGIILAALERQVKGSAEAAANTSPWRQLQVVLGQVGDSIGERLLPIIKQVSDSLSTLLSGFTQLPGGVQTAIIALGAVAAVLGPLLIALGFIVQGLAPLLAGFSAIGAAAATATGPLATVAITFAGLKAATLSLAASFAPFVAIAAAVGLAAVAIYQNWDKIAPVLSELWRTATQTIGPPLRAMVAELGSALSELWNGPLGQGIRAAMDALLQLQLAFFKAFGPVIIQLIRVLLATITEVLKKIGDAIRFVNAILTGDWLGAWRMATGGATSFIGVIKNAILGLLGPIGLVINGLRRMGNLSAQQASVAGPGAMDGPLALARRLSEAAGKAAVKSVASGMPTALKAGGGGAGKTKGGGGGSSGPSAADIARKAAENAARHEDEMGRFRVDQLQAEAEYTQSIHQRRDVALAAIDEELASYQRGINLDQELTAARRAELLEAKQALAAQERRNVEQEFNRDLANQESELFRATIALQMDEVALRSEMADNSRDKLAAELELFKLSERLRIAELDRIMAVEAMASAAWQNANAEKAYMEATRASRQAAVERRNASPGQRYVDGLTLNAGGLADALDRIKINGLENLNDALVDAIVNFKSLADVARSVVKQVLAELLRLQIQQSIIKPLAGLMGLGGGSGGGDIIGGIIAGARASGGPVKAGGTYLVGERGPELFRSGRSGTIIPNHELAGMSGAQIHKPTFVFPGVTDGAMAREAAGQAARRYRRELNPMRAV